MSLFLIYDAENAEYLLQPAGYAVLAAALIVLLAVLPNIGRKKNRPLKTKQLVFCAAAMALAAARSASARMVRGVVPA